MSVNKKGPVIDAGVCRCCGATKRCRLLNVEYEWSGQKETYSDMILDCFGLVLSHLEGEEQERLICATCVSRLREASGFRQQVLMCEERLLRANIQLDEDVADISNGVKPEDAEVKEEKTDINIDLEADYDDAMDLIHNDTEEIKVEPVKKTRNVKRERKSSKVGAKRKKKAGKEDVAEQKEMLLEIQRTNAKLREMQMPAAEISSQCLQRPAEKDRDLSAQSNIMVLVENSYVCPFDTSFSDYYCAYCRQQFTDPNKLREHTLTHDPAGFRTVMNTTATNKKVQIDVYRVDCRLCTLNVQDVASCKDHLTRVHGKVFHPVADDFLKFRLTSGNLSCTECSGSFSFFHALKKHMAEHFGTCICDVCGAHYFEERMLALHQRTHQRVDENYACKDCGKTFKSKYTRYIHVARTHKKEAAYQCSKCDEVFFSYTLRYRHMIESHGEERTFQCGQCDRAYDSRKSLREHNRRFHLKILKHQCDLCDKRFYLPSRLKEHMCSHTGERNFRCECCGKSYPRLRALQVHMQAHGGEKRHRCPACGAAFTQNVNLRNHVRRQHQGLQVDGFRE